MVRGWAAVDQQLVVAQANNVGVGTVNAGKEREREEEGWEKGVKNWGTKNAGRAKRPLNESKEWKRKKHAPPHKPISRLGGGQLLAQLVGAVAAAANPLGIAPVVGGEEACNKERDVTNSDARQRTKAETTITRPEVEAGHLPVEKVAFFDQSEGLPPLSKYLTRHV